MDGEKDPRAFLEQLIADATVDVKLRIDAAKALLPYTETRIADQGKKEERANAAKKAATGRFAPKAPPKLALAAG